MGHEKSLPRGEMLRTLNDEPHRREELAPLGPRPKTHRGAGRHGEPDRDDLDCLGESVFRPWLRVVLLHDERPARTEVGSGPHERCPRVREVMEHVPEHDGVGVGEGSGRWIGGGRGGGEALESGEVPEQATRPRDLRRVEIDPHDRPARRLHREERRQHPEPAAYVQDHPGAREDVPRHPERRARPPLPDA